MSLRCRVFTGTLVGIAAVRVDVEVDIGPGLPGMSIVGLPDAAVQEARERVRSALRVQGFKVPNARIVINLAPGPLRKTGSGFDLPIAIAILVATKQINPKLALASLIVGELSLDGLVRPVPGLLAYALEARKEKLSLLSGVPVEGDFNIEGLDHCCIQKLSDLKNQLYVKPSHALAKKPQSGTDNDFAEIAGNEYAKRALLIAATGFHGISMVGPPGSGKTMMARALPSILPALTHEEILQTSLIHSVAGYDTQDICEGKRPFRSPHHSSSVVGLVGGGNPLRPGEVSLAHNGVLFLDEMPQFAPSVLQSLRQPIEDGVVAIVRAEGRVSYPAKFMLVCASNPCPCGHLGDAEISCKCRPDQVARYQSRVGGPLLDRIDLRIDVKRVDPENVISGKLGTSSAELCEKRMVAQERMQQRGSNGRFLSGQELLRCVQLNEKSQVFLEHAARAYSLSGRGIVRLLRVARTIADIEKSDRVLDEHLAEALGYRILEG